MVVPLPGRKRLVCALASLGLGACGDRPPLRDPHVPDMLDQVPLTTHADPHQLLPPVTIDLSDGLSIDEAMAIAVIANPDLRNARAQRGIASAQVVEASILPNPEVSIGVDVPAFGATTGSIASEHIGLAWEITALVTRDANVRAARAHRDEIEMDVAWQEWQVAIEARMQWRRLAALDHVIALASTSEQDLRAASELLDRALGTRDTTAVEANAAKSALDEAVLARLELERERERARRALARVLGVRVDAPVTLQGVEQSPVEALPALPVLVDSLSAHRLDLRALQLGYASQQERVRSAVLSRVPRIVLDVGAARDTSNVGTVGIGVSVGLPVFDRAQGRIGIESATRLQLQEEYVARVYVARADLDDAYADLVLARNALDAAESSLPHLDQLVATYRSAFAQHLVDAPSVYTASNALNARRIDVLHRRVEIGDLVSKIELASGQLITARGTGP